MLVCRREPSEWIEAGLEQAELVAFGVGEDVPLLLAGLADVGRACPELQEAFEFGVLKPTLRVGPAGMAARISWLQQ